MKTLTRRLLLRSGLGTAAALGLTACGGAEEGTTPNTTSGGRADGTIHLDTYEGWIGPDTFGAFEKANPGVEIDLQFGTSPGDRVSRYLTGASNADMMLMELSWLPALSDRGAVATLDLEQIPNYGLISPEYKVGPFSEEERLGVAIDSGRYGIAYRTDLVTAPIDSWATFFEAAQEYPGRFALEDYAPFGITAALVALGRQINSTDPGDIADARDFLIAHKTALGPLWGNSPTKPLLAGDYYATSMWDLLGPIVVAPGEPVEWAFPTDGVFSWIEGWIAMAGSPVLPAVESLMDFTLKPPMYADFVKATGVSNLMPTADALVGPAIAKSPILAPPRSVVSRTVPSAYLGAALRDYDDAWSAFKAA